MKSINKNMLPKWYGIKRNILIYHKPDTYVPSMNPLYLEWQGKSYLNPKNTFQQKSCATELRSLQCHLCSTVNKHVTVRYNAQRLPFTATSGMAALPHRMSLYIGHCMTAAVLRTTIQEMQSNTEKLQFDVLSYQCPMLSALQTVSVCVCLSSNNKTTGLTLSCKYKVVYTPTVATVCQCMLLQPEDLVTKEDVPLALFIRW